MALINPCSKLERAVLNFLILQGKATVENTITGGFSGGRPLFVPLRDIVVPSFSPAKPYRPEGTVLLLIKHYSDAAIQEGQREGQQRIARDNFVGETYQSMQVGDNQGYRATADAITAAGRVLAVSDGSPEGDLRAADNADMLAFRVDWIEEREPLLLRGRHEGEGSFWSDELGWNCFVSHATN